MPQGATQNQAGKTPSKAGGGGMDAIELLTRDHREVEQMFRRFEQAKDENEKAALCERICLMLQVHTQIEEEIFYPAAKQRIADRELIDEALVEHRGAKDTIEKLQGMEAGDRSLDAQVKKLKEQVQHHVREEEHDMFPEVRKAGLDLDDLGERMMKRKTQLMEQMGADMDGAQPGSRTGEQRTFKGDRGGDGSDLKAREYRDEDGQIHHHTRSKMQEERRKDR
jgi:hypothetical protein